MTTDEDLCKMDLYVFIEVTPRATAQEIRKAYKVKARYLHPDKNPDPNAKELFDKLLTIYNFLNDAKKREMYDKICQQRELRKRKLEEEDSGRKNLRKELERREEAFRLAKVRESKLSEAEKARLQTEKMLEELARQGHFQSSHSSSSVSFASRSSSSSSVPVSSSLPPKKDVSLFKSASVSSSSTTPSPSTTVVIAWEQKKVKETWQVELRLLLEQYGKVGDLVVNKKKALAVFATSTQAEAAVTAHATHPDLKFKLKPMLYVEEEEEQPATAPAPQCAAPDLPARYDDDYEAQTLQLLLRRHQEKQAL